VTADGPFPDWFGPLPAGWQEAPPGALRTALQTGARSAHGELAPLQARVEGRLRQRPARDARVVAPVDPPVDIAPPTERAAAAPHHRAAAPHHRAAAPPAYPPRAAVPLPAYYPPRAAAVPPVYPRAAPIRAPPAHVAPGWYAPPPPAAPQQPMGLQAYLNAPRYDRYLAPHEQLALNIKRKRDADLLSRYEREQEQADNFIESQMQQETLAIQALLQEQKERQRQFKQVRLLAEMKANADGIMELEMMAAAREYEAQQIEAAEEIED